MKPENYDEAEMEQTYIKNITLAAKKFEPVSDTFPIVIIRTFIFTEACIICLFCHCFRELSNL
jgi:hypothetical protein